MSHFNKPDELMELHLSIKPLASGKLLTEAGCGFGFHRGREDMSCLFFTETALLIPLSKLLVLNLCFEALQSCRAT